MRRTGGRPRKAKQKAEQDGPDVYYKVASIRLEIGFEKRAERAARYSLADSKSTSAWIDRGYDKPFNTKTHCVVRDSGGKFAFEQNLKAQTNFPRSPNLSFGRGITLGKANTYIYANLCSNVER